MKDRRPTALTAKAQPLVTAYTHANSVKGIPKQESYYQMDSNGLDK